MTTTNSKTLSAAIEAALSAGYEIPETIKTIQDFIDHFGDLIDPDELRNLKIETYFESLPEEAPKKNAKTLNKKRIIWSSEINIDDWREDLLEYFSDGENHAEYEFYDLARDINADYLDEERTNLDIDLPGEILAFCDCGAWDGRHYSAGEIGKNISDCLFSDCPEQTWYVENGEFRCEEIHHDGRNYITYRMLKPDLTEKQLENFWDKLYMHQINEKNINRYTESIAPYIANVYGWQ